MIDLKELKQALRDMKPRTQFYEVVKAELERQGRWKRLPRGKPTIGESIQPVAKFKHPTDLDNINIQ